MQRVDNFLSSSCQKGVGLIEVLIAVLVLSIGFLGIAALQAKSLSDNNSAMMRTQASIAAYGMFDAMRSDRANAVAGGYNGTVTAGACPAAAASLASNQLATWCLGFNPTDPPLSSWVGASGTYTVANPPPALLLGGLGALGAGTTGTILCQAPTGGASNCSITITFNDSKGTGATAANPNLSLVYWTQL